MKDSPQTLDEGVSVVNVETEPNQNLENRHTEDLPDIESLNADADFTPFLKEGVPEKIKRLALRKLWSSDPAFGIIDGLDDYAEDYSAIGIVAQEIASRYQPGKGMVDPDENKDETVTSTGNQELNKPVEQEEVVDEEKDNLENQRQLNQPEDELEESEKMTVLKNPTENVGENSENTANKKNINR